MSEPQRLLVVGAGPEQRDAIERARAMGLFTIACDGNPEAPGLALADRHEVGDIRRADLLETWLLRHRAEGLLLHAVDVPIAAAEACRAAGLPGLDPAAALTASDKFLRLERLRTAGVPVTDYLVVDDAAAQDFAALDLGGLELPLIVKPLDRSGARGVSLARDRDELVRAVAEALSHSADPRVLLERPLRGPQISTESLVLGDRIAHFAFADRNYRRDAEFFPYFVEDGIDFPSTLPPETQTTVWRVVEDAIGALGIDWGAAKGDVLIEDGTPRILEMAPRSSGGWFGAGSIVDATGVDPLGAMIELALGREPDWSRLEPAHELGCCQRYLIPAGAGVFGGATGHEEVAGREGFRRMNWFFPAVGAKVQKARHHADRWGQVIFTADRRDEAIARAEAAIASVRIHWKEET